MNWKKSLAKISITLIITVILAYSISFISGKINFLERFTIAVTDIDFTDLYYYYRPKPKPDTNIVVVNIGVLNRAELAGLFKIISENKPKAIGIDILFDEEAEVTAGTEMLSEVFKHITNAVFASAYKGTDDNGRDVMEHQSPVIRQHLKEGVVNLNISKDDPEKGTVRSFYPVTTINGESKLSFGFEIGSLWNKDILKKKTEDETFIRWYGYCERANVPDSLVVFKSIDWHRIQDGQYARSELENKIVLVGYAGDVLHERYRPDDKLYTPLNGKMIGRSLPDMYGVEIHANIIKMIIDDNLIYQSKVLDFVFNLIILSLFSLILFWINKKYGRQYSILSKIVLIIFIDLLAFAAIEIFFLSDGAIKILIGEGLFVMLFLPDAYEFLESNLFPKIFKTSPLVQQTQANLTDNG